MLRRYIDFRQLTESGTVECVEYRRNIKTSGKTIWILYDSEGFRIMPSHIYRSKTFSHGWDCYPREVFENNVAVIVRIEISNSGKDYSSVNILKPLSETARMRIMEDLSQEHISDMVLEKLYKALTP